MKKYRFEKSVLHEDGYAIIHNESGEKIAECEDAEKAHFLMTAANSYLDEIELEKEIERLKGLIEKLVKDDNMFHCHVQDSYKEQKWQQYRKSNNL